jgi:PRTRC genetic system ThiF family protein
MFRLDSRLLNQRVNVVVIGVGGSGSHVAADLAVLHQGLMDLGHPAGLGVTLIDADVVSSANVGRARFFDADVGMSKAQVLCHRINMSYGLDFEAVHGELDEDSGLIRDADVVFGCVDTRKSRRSINAALNLKTYPRWRETIWIDLGNGASDGQVVFGTTGKHNRAGPRLPTVVDLYPEMLNPAKDPVDDGPSCSRAESIARQGLFVNKSAALHAVNMLATLMRTGKLDYSAAFFNVNTGKVATLECSPEAWARFGYVAQEDVEKS